MQEGLPARVRAVQEPPLSEPGSNDYALDPVARAEAMSGPPEVPAAPKPPPQPRSVLLGAAKITVRAPIPRVFEALVNAEQLAIWWAEDARIEAELGGRFEGTLPEGRVEGTITAIDGPGKFSYTWPVPHEGGTIETSVVFELSPKGPETAVHVAHRSPLPVAGEWEGVWRRSVESLKAFLEQGAPAPA